jgi:hypothetical protein
MAQWDRILVVALGLALVIPARRARAGSDVAESSRGFRLGVGLSAGPEAFIGLKLHEDDIERIDGTSVALAYGTHLDASWRLASHFALGFAAEVDVFDQGGLFGAQYFVGPDVRFPFRGGVGESAGWNPYLALSPRVGLLALAEGAEPLVGLQARLGVDWVGSSGLGIGLYFAAGDDMIRFLHASVGVELVTGDFM